MKEGSSNSRWLFLDSGESDASTNMAIDDYLAHHVEDNMPVLRFYQWQPFTISLGYGQKSGEIDTDKCRRDNIHIVRRATGGRAVLHAEEVTYSIVIPKESLRHSENILKTYNFISRGLVAGLKALDVDVSLEKRTIGNVKYADKSLLAVPCFSAAAQYEILYRNKKLVGSAQRRFDRAILQHGSILTGDFHLKLIEYLSAVKPDVSKRVRKTLAEKTVCISQILKKSLTYQQIINALKTGFMKEYNLIFTEKKFSEEEISEITKLKTNYPNLWR